MEIDKWLDEVEAREQAATPAPWVNEGDRDVWWGIDPDGGEILVCECTSNDSRERNFANADFIANARTDIPRLLAIARAGVELAEAALEYRRGSICAACAGDHGADFPHPNDKARDAMNTALDNFNRAVKE